MISNPTRLSVEQGSLVVQQQERVKVPLEDVGCVVLDHPQITLTQAVLAEAAQWGVVIVSVSENHTPSGIFTSYLTHSRATGILRSQMAMSIPTRKRLHATIVARKIANQANCLRHLNKSGESQLLSLSRRVRSGDPEGLESQAARAYFLTLFGNDFSRRAKNSTNAALNFGYAILRSAIARSLVSHGFCPAIGLFHDNERNAFNLADDLIEPFRPIVDLVVSLSDEVSEAELSPSIKERLVSTLYLETEIKGENMSTWSAIESCVESLQRVTLGNAHASELDLPTLLEIQKVNREV